MAISEEILFYNFANKPALRGRLVSFFTGRAQWQTAYCCHYAVKMQFSAATLFVKVRLERPAGRDKCEIKIKFPLNMARV